MSYLSRAESMVERGQTMRAFYVLVNGLRQNPNDENALNLLVDLYIRDIDSPGVEGDLLVVLEVVPNGLDIYEMVHASLEQSGDERRLKSLLQTRERDGLLPDFQPPEVSQPAHYPAAPAPSIAPTSMGREARFQRAEPAQPVEQPLPRYDAHPHQSAHEPASYGGTGQPNQQAAPDAWPDAVPRPHASQPHAPRRERLSIDETEDDLYESTRETATTGMFSSINAYLSDQQTMVSEELAQRSKKRMLWIGLAVLIIIVLFVALTSIGGSEAVVEEAAPAEIDPSKPTITEPLPSDG